MVASLEPLAVICVLESLGISIVYLPLVGCFMEYKAPFVMGSTFPLTVNVPARKVWINMKSADSAMECHGDSCQGNAPIASMIKREHRAL